MIVLGIESSCDETGVALYDTGRGLLGHAVHTQVAMYEAYGGVVPELASRDHTRRLIPLLQSVLAESHCVRGDIDLALLLHILPKIINPQRFDLILQTIQMY